MLAEKPLQNMLPAVIGVLTPLLCRMDLAVYSTTDEIGFIASDAPCFWFDPEAYKRPPMYRNPGLMYKSIEITLPVSPQQCIILNRQGVSGYLPVPQWRVDDINQKTRFCAEEYFVVRVNQKRDVWFDPGVEPDDSWEKTHQREAEMESNR